MFSRITTTTAWVCLIIAGLFEIAWVVSMRYSNGFTRLLPSAITIITIAASVFFLSQALRSLPIGIGYSVWTGIGAVGAVAFGSLLFKEQLSLSRSLFIGLIIIGIVGLKMVETTGQKG